MHLGSPVASGEGGSSENCSLFCELCRAIPGLNEVQLDMCIDIPSSLPVLVNSQPIIEGECKWQFRKEQWDCAGVTTPILDEPTFKCKPLSSKLLMTRPIIDLYMNGYIMPYYITRGFD